MEEGVEGPRRWVVEGSMAFAALPFVVACLASADLFSYGPILPSPAALVLVVAGLGAASRILWLVRHGLSSFGRALWAGPAFIVWLTCLLLSYPRQAWVWFAMASISGAAMVIVGVGAVVFTRHGYSAIAALAVVFMCGGLLLVEPAFPTDIRVAGVAERYRNEGDAMIRAGYDPDVEIHASPSVGRSPDGDLVVVWSWAYGLLGGGRGVVYSPSGQDPSGSRAGWSAYRCELRDGDDIWWCVLD